MLVIEGNECQGQEKLDPSTRNNPMHSARNMGKLRTLRACLLSVKGVKWKIKNHIGLRKNENIDSRMSYKHEIHHQGNKHT